MAIDYLLEQGYTKFYLIGTDYVARSAPDGHTLLATVNQTLTSNRFLYKNLPYDPDRSITPIMEMVESEQLILANSAVPARDLREFIALAKRDPSKYPFGSFGQGTQPHLLFALMNKRESTSLTHIPYKGVAPLMTAVAAGEVPAVRIVDEAVSIIVQPVNGAIARVHPDVRC